MALSLHIRVGIGLAEAWLNVCIFALLDLHLVKIYIRILKIKSLNHPNTTKLKLASCSVDLEDHLK